MEIFVRKFELLLVRFAPVPLRLIEVEKFLENTEITEEKIKEAQRIAMESVFTHQRCTYYCRLQASSRGCVCEKFNTKFNEWRAT